MATFSQKNLNVGSYFRTAINCLLLGTIKFILKIFRSLNAQPGAGTAEHFTVVISNQTQKVVAFSPTGTRTQVL